MNNQTSNGKDWYFTFTRWMIEDLGLAGSDLLVYSVIYSFSQGNEQYFFGNYETLAHYAGVSRATAMRSLDTLIAKGMVERERVEKAGKRYRFKCSKLQQLQIATVTKCNTQVLQNDTLSVANCNYESSKLQLPSVANCNTNIDTIDKNYNTTIESHTREEEKDNSSLPLPPSGQPQYDDNPADLNGDPAFIEWCIRRVGVNYDTTLSLMDKFIEECKVLGQNHRDRRDLRSHFFYWATKRVAEMKKSGELSANMIVRYN